MCPCGQKLSWIVDQAKDLMLLSPLLLIRSWPFWCCLKACSVRLVFVFPAWALETTLYNQYFSTFMRHVLSSRLACIGCGEHRQCKIKSPFSGAMAAGWRPTVETGAKKHALDAAAVGLAVLTEQLSALSSSSAVLPQTRPPCAPC